jgi:hypothetical protein
MKMKMKISQRNKETAVRFTAQVASGAAGGTIELRLNGPEGTLIGSCAVGNTGGWQQWTAVSGPVSGAVGVQDLYLRFVGGDGLLLNLDYWRME